MRLPIAFGLVLLACACAGAAPNPPPPTQPSPWRPPAKGEARADAPSASVVSSSTVASATVEPSAASAPAQAGGDKPATSAGPAAKPSTGSAGDASSANSGGDACDPIVAMVAGKPVHVSELLAQWLYTDSLYTLESLDNLALGRIVVIEATRLGIKIDPDEVAKSYDKATQAMQSTISKKFPDMTLDRYVDRALGLDPIRFRERMHDDVLRSLLTDRVARAWLLGNEHVFLRIIVLDQEDALKDVQAELASGASFEDVARKHSVDSSAKDGGRIAPITKGDTAIAKLAFETKVGEVGGPIHERGAWLLLRVDKRPEPLTGDWSKIGKQVEASLAEQPVDGLELTPWRHAMAARYTISFNPFLHLVGENGR